MLVSIFDLIGHYGPVISFALTFYSIIHQIPYLTAFVFGSILNILLNIYLKTTIREPRPENQIEYIDHDDLTGFNEFGMPSGHAQSVMFALVFLFLVKGPTAFTYAILFIAALTIYQRWKYNRHTIKQLMIGSIVGGLFAWLVFHATDTYLHGNVL